MKPPTLKQKFKVDFILRQCMLRHLKRNDRAYDIGCGSSPFADLVRSIPASYVGIDADYGFYGLGAVDIVGVADALPLTDASADALLSNVVLEHLPDPEAAMKEMHRVLKPGGLLFISFPFLYPLHAAPHDYFRYTVHGFAAMCRRHGFEIVEEHEQSGFWYVTSYFTELYLGMFNRSVLRHLRLVSIALFLLNMLFRLFHEAEGLMFAIVRRNVASTRRLWTVSYVFVARRSSDRDRKAS